MAVAVLDARSRPERVFDEAPPTRFLRLRDGRRLSYTEWGDPRGAPIIHQHGMPGSRLEHEADSGFYRELGVRVITPDRPGYGLSDPLRRRRLIDWPADMLELADALAIDRFGITALSGGGVYALACAAAIPDRLTRVVVTGCPGPMQRPGALRQMRMATRAGVWLAGRAPSAFEAGANLIANVVRRHPGLFVRQSAWDKPAADRRWLSMPEVSRVAVDTLREALHKGAWGYVQDIRVLALPWGFDLAGVHVPVELWHGEEDNVIPLHHGHYLASVVPSATLRICPGEGHMVLWNHLAEILTAAAGRRRLH